MKLPENRFFRLVNIFSKPDIARFLLTILSFLVAFFGLGSLAYLVNLTPITLSITHDSLLMVGISLAAIFLARKNKPSLAVLLMLLACGAVLFRAAWPGSGLSGTAFLLTGLLVTGATMYWGQRVGLGALLVVALYGLFLFFARRAGWLVNGSRLPEDWFMLAVLIGNFAVITLIIGIVLQYLEKMVSRMRANEQEIRRLNAKLEQRAAERTAQLAESERTLKIISENVQDIIWTTDLQMRTTFMTASAVRLRGFTIQEMLEESLEQAVTPESYALAMQVFQQEFELEVKGGASPNRSRVLQLDYYRKDGSTIRVELRASFLRDEQGRPIGITGITRDISERSWMEKALLESEERYRKISSVISDYSYSAKVDAQGRFSPEWVAGAFAEITGYEFDEYLAAGGWENLLHPDSASQGLLDRQNTLSNRPIEGSVLKIRRKDGEIRWVRNFAQPVWHPTENRLAGVYGGVQDFTAEKLATERLESLNADLEKRVAERTTRLETALSELESFSYSISHDLRAPLRAVNGYAGMLLAEHRAGFSPDVIEKLQAIKENGQRMGQLVDGLLQFLRSGSEKIERQTVNPGEIAQSVLDRLQPQIENRPVEILVEELPPCSANLRLLDKVYEGLISNAIKFTRNRNPARIEIGVLEQDGRQVYFVRDNGVGFDMKYYDKLFGVFQRLHHLSEFEGIGASLAIVQRIINRHGGLIWAEAEVEKGATFYFTLG